MHSTHRCVRSAITLALAALLLAGTAPPAAAAEKVKVTLPASAVTFVSLYHAKTAGYFAAEGLDVEIVTVPGGGSLQALIAKDAQVCLTPGTYQLQAIAKGQKLIATGSSLVRNSINVVMHKDAAREKGITDKSPLADRIKALKGLKLSGTAVGSFSYQVLLYYLLKAGLDPQKDVELIGIGAGPAMVLALEQRKVDGFATGTPVPDAAVHRGFGVMIVDNAAGEDPDFSEFMMLNLVFHPDYVKEKPDVVRKFTHAMIKANRWVRDNPAEAAVASVKPFLGRLSDEVLLDGLRKVRPGVPADGRITERANQLTQDFMVKIGALKDRIPYDAVVTNEFLPR